MSDGKTRGRQLITWVDRQFDIGNSNSYELDDSYTRIETPAEFKTGLYEHQEVTVRALLDLESKRYVTATDRYNNNIIVDNQACILSEKLGSGKTIELLALICISRQPKLIIPENINLIQLEKNYNGFRLANKHGLNNTNGVCDEIRRRYNTILRSNIIVVGKSVIRQWERAIESFTSLTYFTISDQRTLKDFYKMYRKGIITYDIILLKNSNVRHFYMQGENPQESPQIRCLPDVVAKITQNTPFSRAIYDDFDTINISRDVIKINALYTIFVSTTRNRDKHHTNFWERLSTNKEYDTAIDLINDVYGQRRLLDVFTDAQLFSVFNIHNTEEYVKKSTNIPIFETFKCVYNNPADTYIGLMGNLGAHEVAEMMNGDAMRTAAETLGITGNSPFEIFKRLLRNKYERYMTNKHLMQCVEKLREYAKTLTDMRDRPPTIDVNGNEKHYPTNHTDAQIQVIVSETKKAAKSRSFNDAKLKTMVKYKSKKLMFALNEFFASVERDYEISGIEINRMKDNLREQMCVVCKMDTDGEDVLIPRCCSNIIDSDCFHTEHVDGRNNQIRVKCPGCGESVDLSSDIVYIKGDFDLESLLDAEGDEIVEKEEQPERDEEEKIDNPKLQALWDILNKRRPDNTEEIKFRMNAVIEGRTNISQDDRNRKILLFANFNETLELVEEFLQTRKKSYLRLQGDYKKVDDIIHQFRNDESIPILLINSQQNCAGLNLQFATTVVFFHKLINRHIESQVVGRAQRIGRECNLEIYYLLYNNEANTVGNNKDISIND